MTITAPAERTPTYLTVAEVARELGVSACTIRRRISAGELPAVQLGGRGSPVRVHKDSLQLWLWGVRG